MKILFGSDFHGLSEAYQRFADLLASPGFDVGVISGDLTSFSHDPAEQQRSLKEILWKAEKTVFVVMGNDDGLLGNEWTSEKNVHNINLTKASLNGYIFIGYCYTNLHISGLFKRSEQEQEKDFGRLAKYLDEKVVLITHGPAYGVLDQAAFGIHIGSHALARLLSKNKVAYHLFGHAHSSFGHSGNSVNGAYPKSHQFFSVDLDTGEIEVV